jgi:hypothetical protein
MATESTPQPTPAPTTAAEAGTRLSVLAADPKWSERFFSGDIAARDEFSALTGIIAGADEAAAAMEGSTAASPIFETTSGHELPAHARAGAVAALRESGVRDEVIKQTLENTKVSVQEVAQAKQYQTMRHADKEWVSKLLAGDIAARREQMLLSIILSSEIAE